MYKKVLSIILILSIMLSVYSVPVVASETQEFLSEDKKAELIHYGDYFIDETNGAHIFTLENEVTSAFSSRSVGNEIIIEKTVYAICPVTEEADTNISEMLSQARSGGSNYIYDSDASGAIEAYITVYYENQTISGKDYVYLTSVKGGFTGDGSGSIISSGVTVNSQKVVYGQSGISSSGIAKTQNKTTTISASSRSFSVIPPSSWVPVAAESETATVGATYTITLERGSGTWSCILNNNLSF